MTTRLRTGAVLVGLVLLGGVAASPWMASAGHGHLNDPKDTKGVLDVRRVETGGAVMRPHWKIITFAKWTPQRIRDAGYLVVNLDMRGDNFYEHYVLVRSNGSRLRASLFRDRKDKSAKFLRNVEVWRPNDKTVSVRLPIQQLLGPNRNHYRWFINSIFTSNKCPSVCIDRIPDNGAVREIILPPKPEPTEPEEPVMPESTEPEPTASSAGREQQVEPEEPVTPEPTETEGSL